MQTKRAAFVLSAIVLSMLAEVPRARADGWYFAEGLGAVDVGNDLGRYFEGDFRIRAAVGRRMGRLAVEGFLTGTILSGQGVLSGYGSHGLSGYGLSARYMFPLGRHFEVYARGGLHKLRLDVQGEQADSGYSGRALHYGAGIQVKGKVPVIGFLFYPLFFTNIGPKVTAALWLETTTEYTRLHHPEYRSLDGTASGWLAGFGLGGDF